jgi:hypothetical protein
MPTNRGAVKGSTAVQTADHKPLVTHRSNSYYKVEVVGSYGVLDFGKTSLLNWLKQELGQDCFTFYDGFEVIRSIVSDGLDAFQKLKEKEKEHWREVAINKIREEWIGGNNNIYV